MRRMPLLRLALIASAALVRPIAAQTPADTGRFESEIRAFETHDRQAPPPAGSVLFVGSSSIRMWCTLDRDFPTLRVLNRGFGGPDGLHMNSAGYALWRATLLPVLAPR